MYGRHVVQGVDAWFEVLGDQRRVDMVGRSRVGIARFQSFGIHPGAKIDGITPGDQYMQIMKSRGRKDAGSEEEIITRPTNK